MRSLRSTERGDRTNSRADNLAERLQQLEALTGGAVRRQSEADVIPEPAPSVALVPAPRRSRIFLRHGEGHGEFADLTLTAPIVRSRLAAARLT